MSKPILTQEYLKEIITYDPKTGVFKWRKEVRKFGEPLKGKRAGCITYDGYRIITINEKAYRGSHLAWLYSYGTLPDKVIDHINHNKDDDRITNLRHVTTSENQRNRMFIKNSTGHMGIEYEKDRNKWRPRIKVANKPIYLGRYNTLEEAIVVRKQALKDHSFHPNHGTIQ